MYEIPGIFVSDDHLAVFVFHLLTIEVPRPVVEWILITFLAITLVAASLELESSQVYTLSTPSYPPRRWLMIR